MELYSQLDPFKDIELQERFPNGVPTHFDPPPAPPNQIPLPGPFQWNGAPPYVCWETGYRDSYLQPYGLAGDTPGYKYNAKVDDFLGFRGWTGSARTYPGITAVLSTVHEFFAATCVTSVGGGGLFVGRYTIRMFTNETEHIGP